MSEPTLAPGAALPAENGTLPSGPETASEVPFSVLTVREHPWGCFYPGSWRHLQTVTWTAQVNQQTGQIKETKTTLISADEEGVTLEEAGSVMMGKGWLQSTPQKKRYDFYQEPIADGVEVKLLPPHKLSVGNLIVPCERRTYQQETPFGKQKTTLWYTTQVYPYVFRVERVLRSLPTDKDPEERILNQSVTEVLDTSAFYLRKNRFSGTYRLKTVRRSGSMTTVTETSCSRYIPGGVYQETTRELDAEGKEIRTSETRLINYHCAVPVYPEPSYLVLPPEYGPFPGTATPPHSLPAENGVPEAQPTVPTPNSEPMPLPIRPRWRRFRVVEFY